MSDVGESGWLRPGSRLIGKYEIVRPIGRGGFGLVYEANHLGLRARVAIKVLRSEGRQHPQTLERFRREAWASAQIASPHVVRVTDVDVLEDGTPFIVMELLQGRDLEAELQARGRLPIRELVGYVLQAALAIHEAHLRGVVHRDLKPNNLFLAEQGGSRSVKVLDFGLSKLASELSVTKTSAQLGTPLYMSPEQLRSAKSVDGRSDIWALGVILYRMLTLRAPFEGATATDVMVGIMSQTAPELTRLAPNVPAELANVVMRALRKDPAERFQNVTELANALAPFGPPGAFSQVLTLPLNAPQLGPSTTLTDSSQDTPAAPPARRGRGIFTAAAVLLGMVLAGGLLRVWWVSRAIQADAAGNALSPAAQPVASLPVPSGVPVVTPAPGVVSPPDSRPSGIASSSEPRAATTAPTKGRAATNGATPNAAGTKPAPKPATKQDLGF
jgi:eukaryotic-like serine/threonine-protein kinase